MKLKLNVQLSGIYATEIDCSIYPDAKRHEEALRLIAVAQEKGGFSYGDIADEWHNTDIGTIYLIYLDEDRKYQLWISIWIDDVNYHVTYESDILSELREWHWSELGGYARYSEFATQWQFDLEDIGDEKIVDASYPGPCWVWYEKRSTKRSGGIFVRDDDYVDVGDMPPVLKEFANGAEADEWIGDNYPDVIYITNEIWGGPIYRIVAVS